MRTCVAAGMPQRLLFCYAFGGFAKTVEIAAKIGYNQAVHHPQRS
jgi:hypothetical protein